MSAVQPNGEARGLSTVGRLTELLDDMCAAQASYETVTNSIEARDIDRDMARIRGEILALFGARSPEPEGAE